jgi:hypothetical protein
MQERVDAAVVWEELRRLVRSRATGMLFLTAEDNSAGRIGVKAGTIVFLAYRFSAGRAAIPQLQTIRSAEFRFETTTPGQLPNMPTTDEILAMLKGSSVSAPPTSGSRVSAPPPKTSAAQPPAPMLATSRVMTDHVKQELGRLLADYMGPIAPIVFEEHWTNGQAKGHALETIIDALAKELGGPRAAEFKAKAIAKFR